MFLSLFFPKSLFLWVFMTFFAWKIRTNARNAQSFLRCISMRVQNIFAEQKYQHSGLGMVWIRFLGKLPNVLAIMLKGGRLSSSQISLATLCPPPCCHDSYMHNNRQGVFVFGERGFFDRLSVNLKKCFAREWVILYLRGRILKNVWIYG